MSVVIAMPRPAQGAPPQGGYCGNYNGIPEDDAKPVVPSWNTPLGTGLGPVPRSLNLFKGKSAPASLVAYTSALEEQPEARRPEEGELRSLRELLDVVARCPEELKAQASERCSRVEDARMQRDCIFDVCLTKDVQAADEALAGEVLRDAINAKGVPIFMGHGECLDSRSQRFTSIGTNLRTDSECQEVLRQLALTKGVLGSQIRRGSSCQVIVDVSVDPTSVKIPGGWSPGGSGTAEPYVWGAGQGLIRDISRDASWSCWQLN
mmetsp:Transcript_108210/g.323603  ORF Transcript_108210/g.323603 Transcript_108210/m.323603 type:complete len:264 (+) Transcript_108210:276-1067(+)